MGKDESTLEIILEKLQNIETNVKTIEECILSEVTAKLEAFKTEIIDKMMIKHLESINKVSESLSEKLNKNTVVLLEHESKLENHEERLVKHEEIVESIKTKMQIRDQIFEQQQKLMEKISRRMVGASVVFSIVILLNLIVTIVAYFHMK